MVRTGYLIELSSREGQECVGCLMNKTCSVPVPEGNARMKMYALTEKGMEQINSIR